MSLHGYVELNYWLLLCMLVNERVRRRNNRLYFKDRTRVIALSIRLHSSLAEGIDTEANSKGNPDKRQAVLHTGQVGTPHKLQIQVQVLV